MSGTLTHLSLPLGFFLPNLIFFSFENSASWQISSEEFLELYFSALYPYAPILDRRKFLHSYETGQYSSFLFQALLANVVPHASIDLIQRAGFSTHRVAQKAFFKRASILHDIGCEKSQLHLLQGSLMMGAQWVTFASDKDYRFWLLNAIRIATRLGLHRE